jgi:hypothetical protein
MHIGYFFLELFHFVKLSLKAERTEAKSRLINQSKQTEALFSSRIFLDFDTVAFSLLFGY